jgi:hypothetical protein
MKSKNSHRKQKRPGSHRPLMLQDLPDEYSSFELTFLRSVPFNLVVLELTAIVVHTLYPRFKHVERKAIDPGQRRVDLGKCP